MDTKQGRCSQGALAAIAACVLSGRDDWRKRVIYFGLFGMLGWAFGGSISYMMVIGYTQSGHSSTQLFGFFGLFLIGFLWAAIGGGATAIPAVLSSEQLAKLFQPLAALLGAWCVMYFANEPLMAWIQRVFEIDGIPSPSRRQELALYWFDSDWFEVSVILSVVLAFEVMQRRGEKVYRLPIYAAAGAATVFLLAFALDITIGTEWIGQTMVQKQGAFEDRFSAEQLAVTNWPPALIHMGQTTRWYYQGDGLALMIGAIIGVAFYFVLHARFSAALKLPLYMCLGWFAGFLLLPVIGSLFFPHLGGMRMTPPRSDNWAGVLGMFVAAAIYLWQFNLKRILQVAIVCGVVGGIGFSGTACLEACLVSIGNRNIAGDEEVAKKWQAWQDTTWVPSDWTKGERMSLPSFVNELPNDNRWSHWQSQNWHSFLEQTYGFVNGLGVAIAAWDPVRSSTVGRRRTDTIVLDEDPF